MEKVRPWCGQPSDRGVIEYNTEMTEGRVELPFVIGRVFQRTEASIIRISWDTHTQPALAGYTRPTIMGARLVSRAAVGGARASLSFR